jgi:hypothetical protein
MTNNQQQHVVNTNKTVFVAHATHPKDSVAPSNESDRTLIRVSGMNGVRPPASRNTLEAWTIRATRERRRRLTARRKKIDPRSHPRKAATEATACGKNKQRSLLRNSRNERTLSSLRLLAATCHGAGRGPCSSLTRLTRLAVS